MNKVLILSLTLVSSLSFAANPSNDPTCDSLYGNRFLGAWDLNLRMCRKKGNPKQYDEFKKEVNEHIWDGGKTVAKVGAVVIAGAIAVNVAAPVAIAVITAGSGAAAPAVSPVVAEHGIKVAGALLGGAAEKLGVVDKIQGAVSGMKNPLVPIAMPAPDKNDDNKFVASNRSVAPAAPVAPAAVPETPAGPSFGEKAREMGSWAVSQSASFIGGAVATVAMQKVVGKMSGAEQREKEDRIERERQHREKIESETRIGDLTAQNTKAQYSVAYFSEQLVKSNEKMVILPRHNPQDLLTLSHERQG